MRYALTVAVFYGAAIDASAGIYVPGETPPFEVGEDGFAAPLPFDSFRLLWSDARAGYVDKDDQGNPSKEYLRLAQRIEELGPDGDVAELTALQMRNRRFDAAFNRLQAATRSRAARFPVFTHFAWVLFLRGEYTQTLDKQSLAKDYFPRKIEGYSPGQVAWYRRLEREYIPALLKARFQQRLLDDRSPDKPPLGLDPLFGDVDFGGVEDFQAGALSPEEKGKLPKDAIAIVQQLVLWAPFDAQLYWLLGELYNAEGDVETAMKLYDDCTNAYTFTNPTLLAHRRAVSQELASRVPDPVPLLEWGPKLWAVIGVGALIFVALGYWQVRELRRRARR